MELYLSPEKRDLMLDRVKRCLLVQEVVHRGDIQPLWSGFGVLSRLYLPAKQQTVIVKYIVPPEAFEHPRGWNGETSQQRKRVSYEVENAFYRDYASRLNPNCRIPALLASHADAEYQILVLEDLDVKGFDRRSTQLSEKQLLAAVDWLGQFHGTLLGEAGEGLWATGCYWHLQTRQEEWQNMVSGPLKTFAGSIDKILAEARFHTIVHGDAKAANLCLHSEDTKLAVVDFQYTGKGVGVKDLAYFLGSCLSSEQLYKAERMVLERYFTTLENVVRQSHPQVDTASLEREWRTLYPFAWADFHRFLAGWAPDHVKINPYMQSKSEEALASL